MEESNYFTSLRKEQRLRSSLVHGNKRRVNHMVTFSLFLAVCWLACALREHKQSESLLRDSDATTGLFGSFMESAEGGTTRDGLEYDGLARGGGGGGDKIPESLYEGYQKHNQSAEEKEAASQAQFLRGLLKATCGWVSLAVGVAAAVLQAKEERNRPKQNLFPTLPGSSDLSSPNHIVVGGSSNGRDGGAGSRKTHATSPRRGGKVGELQRLGATTGAMRQLGAGGSGMPRGQPTGGSANPMMGAGAQGGHSNGLGGGSSGSLGGHYNLEQLLEEDRKRSAEEAHVNTTLNGSINLLGGGRPNVLGGLGGMMSNYGRGPHQQESRRMQVKFGTESRGVETNVAATDSEWALLGVRDAELATIRITEWISKALLAVSGEIDRCNKWFAEKQLSAFDCSNSLADPFAVHSASSAPSWGSSTTNAQHAKVDKLTCLTNEKQKLQQQPHNLAVYEMIVHLDLRLKLEKLLSVGETFNRGGHGGRSGGGNYESEATRCQAYVIRRIKSLGAQSTLNGFHASGGEPEVWSEDYPIDAHLVTHVLIHQYPAFSRHVKLPHQPMADRRDLAMFVGSVGEPYFYVKYRNPPAQPEKIFHTKQGPDSMFQALLIFVALIAKYHDNAYGGVFGVVDLEQLGLGNVVRS